MLARGPRWGCVGRRRGQDRVRAGRLRAAEPLGRQSPARGPAGLAGRRPGQVRTAWRARLCHPSAAPAWGRGGPRSSGGQFEAGVGVVRRGWGRAARRLFTREGRKGLGVEAAWLLRRLQMALPVTWPCEHEMPPALCVAELRPQLGAGEVGPGVASGAPPAHCAWASPLPTAALAKWSPHCQDPSPVS